eukprot:gnl/Spiro4/21793_TR10684_c0_g1_i1.p1 gnl/Spiro4/21793_TR10684_c0_g1~~gnl/Spiro4/21793_TR10684_c0_g1_i1.p1  ORF type:complete len:318 (-),score=70.14 gnl/Spiro4/21793_TR10684_c0_g1_i1:125-1000(-)
MSAKVSATPDPESGVVELSTRTPAVDPFMAMHFDDHHHPPAHKTYEHNGTVHASGIMGPLVRRHHRASPSNALVDDSQQTPAPPPPPPPPPAAHHGFANPGPLGLSAFAGTTFLLSLTNANIGTYVPEIVLGMAFFYGGLVQILAGMWEMAVGNTFGATAFSSYGAFWMSYAWIVQPQTGILTVYATGPNGHIANAVGMYLMVWTFFTWIMTLGAVKTNMSLLIIFVVLSFAFPCLAIGAFTGVADVPHNGWTQAGGYLGLICAFMAWYTAATGLWTPTTAYFVLPNPKLG